MTSLKAFELGVTDLISYIFREGSIDSRKSNKARMQLGSKIHKLIQDRDQKEKDNYQKEVYFKYTHILNDYTFTLTGRADAIYSQNNKPIIEEIKSTYKFKNKSFQASQAHLAQLYFYGFFYMMENNLESIDLILHYYHIISEEETYIKEHKTLKELKDFVNEILDLWIEIGFFQSDWISLRNKSINDLPFIHENFRPGQREISLAVFNTIKRSDKVLIEAPTGIGKTIGTLFPALKQLPYNKYNQIFYLTAKTTIQNEAIKAINLMRQKGLELKSTVITARDKICFLNQKKPSSRNCNPDDCEFAKDYFDKINTVLVNCLKAYSNFDRSLIEKIALENKICPYQLTLDLCNWTDLIICDYNYMFDPISSLQGFEKDKIILIDEAHNLPDRSRSMYSAELNLNTFINLREVLNTKSAILEKENLKLKKQVEYFICFLKELKETNQTKEIENLEISNKTLSKINSYIFNFQKASFRYLTKINDKKITLNPDIIKAFNECSKEVFRFNIISELGIEKDNYFKYLKLNKKNISIRLACLDASNFIDEKINNYPTVFFSATLTPFDYYQTILLNKSSVPTLSLPSPFNPNHYKVICDDSISTRYKDREISYNKIAKIIKTVITSKKGNYLIFFPSYNYLHTVYEIFVKLVNNEDLNVLIQDPDMNEAERESFINNFKNRTNTIGFCVMGGIFSEGIDLPLDSLIGAIIIGPGLPGIEFERNLIKDYYQDENGEGFAYAYAYPGMNRVLQSAGRVIRTDEDRGIILLIDDRFRSPLYKKMIPRHLKPDYLNHPDDLEIILQKFWKKN